MAGPTSFTLTVDNKSINAPNKEAIPFDDNMVDFSIQQLKNAVVKLMSNVATRARVIEEVMKESEDPTGRAFYLDAAEFQIYQECAGGLSGPSGVQGRWIGLNPAVIILAHAMLLQYHFQKPLAKLLNIVHLHTFDNALTTTLELILRFHSRSL
ncbi:hypothetical protein EC957_002669 [Mortierella hygrophila]|uniref:Uncharacterized protein n=1 Tax=Mortierella hygrophila TaxID=979708 RepID=A0A9P6F3T5_9FUNG|nr:hypothetical protein EC957_002669 [Mortierella hygrophila]